MKKEAKHNKHVKAETKQTKNLGFLGNGITYARIGLRTHDHAYANPCPENPKNAEREQNFKTTILTP